MTFLLGLGIGRRAKKPEPNAAICPCKHTIGEHENLTGRCQSQIKRPHYYVNGSRNGHEWVKCPCLHYAGPELISSISMRSIAQGDS